MMTDEEFKGLVAGLAGAQAEFQAMMERSRAAARAVPGDFKPRALACQACQRRESTGTMRRDTW